MSPSPLLVIGATGKTGRRVTAQLQQRGLAVRAVSRKSEVPFDWDDATTWRRAVEGVRAVYVVHAGLGTTEASDQVGEFAKVAAAAGVTKAVLASTPDDGSAFSQSMRAAERHILDAGLGLTSLRLRWFFQNFSEDFLLPSVLSGELRLPAGDGKEAFVDAQDIAEVAAAALTDDRHNGKCYDLTGPRTLSFAEVAREISRGAGHPVSYVAVEPDVFVAEQIAMGVPAQWADTFSHLYQDIAQEKLDLVSNDIEAVLGKPPRDFADFVASVAQDGTWRAHSAH
ncbi:NmrA/HSCARG family protein [Acidovorax sp. SUPP1855]|uniref:NmrA family NAD(P)-binding protein n=1 Tax=Acidovorax sp. SUPP1855 TaxID=431774 RepID=UPI0023DE6338|nr:NmrA family NAD(P)-binding protein [Acidovorax sp. SUPP1855]GKS86933.1 NmrA/HSCARG family protein [Acidovorax sp. SUPP1855]